MPSAIPSATARNNAAICRAVPGSDRKRTSENVPATATPAPMLPETIIIITWTMAGRIARVRQKLREKFARKEKHRAVSRPSTRDTAVQMKKLWAVKPLASRELNMGGHNLFIKYVRQNKPGIAGADFRKGASINLVAAQGLCQPQGHGAGHLDFHQGHILGQNPLPV